MLILILRRCPAICILGVLLISGCSSGKDDMTEKRLAGMAGGSLKSVVPVSGAVTIDGEPAQGVNLYLHKEEGGASVKESRTGEDGTYCWSTNLQCDGLEPGTYRLAFEHIPKPRRNDKGVDLFKGKYKNPMKHEFKLTVEDGAPQTGVDYELSKK